MSEGERPNVNVMEVRRGGARSRHQDAPQQRGSHQGLPGFGPRNTGGRSWSGLTATITCSGPASCAASKTADNRPIRRFAQRQKQLFSGS